MHALDIHCSADSTVFGRGLKRRGSSGLGWDSRLIWRDSLAVDPLYYPGAASDSRKGLFVRYFTLFRKGVEFTSPIRFNDVAFVFL